MFYRNRVYQRYFSERCEIKGEKQEKCDGRECDCDYVLEGIKGSVAAEYAIKIPRVVNRVRLTTEQRMNLVLEDVRKNFSLHEGTVTRIIPSITPCIRRIISASPNMSLYPAPFEHTYIPQPVPTFIHRGIRDLFVRGDAWLMRSYGMIPEADMGWFYRNEVELDMQPWQQVPSLKKLAFNALSPYKRAFGTYKGRPSVLSSTVNIDQKMINSVGLMARPQAPTPTFLRDLELVVEAKRLLYKVLGTEEFFSQVSPKIDLEDLEDIPLHTGAGLNPGKMKTFSYKGVTYIVNPRGKKRENLMASVESLVRFIETGIPPFVSFSTSLKTEHVFLNLATMRDDALYAKALLKCRLFVIPNLVFILMERIISRAKMVIDKKRIRVGHKWVWGGMEELFRILSPDGRKRRFFDGDFSKWDLSVKRLLLEIYMSEAMKYYSKEKDPEMYKVMELLCRTVAERMFDRLQHIFDDIWAKVQGHVPSGQYQTSHANSWINLFLFTLYSVVQIAKMSPKDQKKAWEGYILAVIYIVYGDDHVLSLVDDPFWLTHFSYYGFVRWLKESHGMEVRDIHETDEFHSEVKNGLLVRRGIIFLKHYAIINPDTRPGQAIYIPWRPFLEMTQKLAWGREPSRRDLIDVALSIIGHVYGTYGSDERTYGYLRFMWEQIAQQTSNQGTLHILVLATAKDRWDVRRFKQYGLEQNSFDGKFPTLEALRNKNFYDPTQHSTNPVFPS